MRDRVRVLNHLVTIRGSDDFLARTRDALAHLSRSSTGVHALSFIDRIHQARRSGMRADARKPTFDVADATSAPQGVERLAQALWYASAIAHDGTHARLYREARTRFRAPLDDAWTGATAEAKCLEVQATVLREMKNGDRDIDDTCEQYARLVEATLACGDKYWADSLPDYWARDW